MLFDKMTESKIITANGIKLPINKKFDKDVNIIIQKNLASDDIVNKRQQLTKVYCKTHPNEPYDDNTSVEMDEESVKEVFSLAVNILNDYPDFLKHNNEKLMSGMRVAYFATIKVHELKSVIEISRLVMQSIVDCINNMASYNDSIKNIETNARAGITQIDNLKYPEFPSYDVDEIVDKFTYNPNKNFIIKFCNVLLQTAAIYSNFYIAYSSLIETTANGLCDGKCRYIIINKDVLPGTISFESIVY